MFPLSPTPGGCVCFFPFLFVQIPFFNLQFSSPIFDLACFPFFPFSPHSVVILISSSQSQSCTFFQCFLRTTIPYGLQIAFVLFHKSSFLTSRLVSANTFMNFFLKFASPRYQTVHVLVTLPNLFHSFLTSIYQTLDTADLAQKTIL